MSTLLDRHDGCAAVFHGRHFDGFECGRASAVFEVGQVYQVTGKIVYRWETTIEIEGIAGEWDPRLFSANLTGVPVRKEFGYPKQEEREGTRPIALLRMLLGRLWSIIRG